MKRESRLTDVVKKGQFKKIKTHEEERERESDKRKDQGGAVWKIRRVRTGKMGTNR